MGLSKTQEFTDTQNQLARWAKALGHPARIAILQVLMNRQTCVCGEIVEELPLSQSTISQHLKALKEAGIIQGTLNGPTTCYCIDNQAWEVIRRALDGFFELKQKGSNCC